jgi:GTP-binding protein
VQELIDYTGEWLDNYVEEPETEDEVVFYDENEEDPDKITISRNISGELVVSGTNIEKLVKMTNFLNDEAVRRFQYIWRIKNLDEKLREKGAKEGDTIHIGEMEFEFRD